MILCEKDYIGFTEPEFGLSGGFSDSTVCCTEETDSVGKKQILSGSFTSCYSQNGSTSFYTSAYITYIWADF